MKQLCFNSALLFISGESEISENQFCVVLHLSTLSNFVIYQFVVKKETLNWSQSRTWSLVGTICSKCVLSKDSKLFVLVLIKNFNLKMVPLIIHNLKKLLQSEMMRYRNEGCFMLICIS